MKDNITYKEIERYIAFAVIMAGIIGSWFSSQSNQALLAYKIDQNTKSIAAISLKTDEIIDQHFSFDKSISIDRDHISQLQIAVFGHTSELQSADSSATLR